MVKNVMLMMKMMMMMGMRMRMRMLNKYKKNGDEGVDDEVSDDEIAVGSAYNSDVV